MKKKKFDEDNLPDQRPESGDDKIPYECSETRTDMAQVAEAIKRACANGLLVEVVTWALYAQSAEPDLMPGSAMQHGLAEWDC